LRDLILDPAVEGFDRVGGRLVGDLALVGGLQRLDPPLALDRGRESLGDLLDHFGVLLLRGGPHLLGLGVGGGRRSIVAIAPSTPASIWPPPTHSRAKWTR
jgi:hypothetical protein